MTIIDDNLFSLLTQITDYLKTKYKDENISQFLIMMSVCVFIQFQRYKQQCMHNKTKLIMPFTQIFTMNSNNKKSVVD